MYRSDTGFQTVVLVYTSNKIKKNVKNSEKNNSIRKPAVSEPKARIVEVSVEETVTLHFFHIYK